MLLGELSEVEWAQFCEQVDAIVTPFNKQGKLIRLCGTITFAAAAIVGVAGYFYSPDFFEQSDRGNTNGNPGSSINLSNPYAIGFVLAILISSFISIGGYIYAAKKRQRGFAEVKSICERISIRYQTFSFHLRAKQFQTHNEAHEDPYILIMMNRQQQGP